MPSARLIGVGVFVIGGLLIFALGLFMIGDRRSLFADLFVVNAEFAQVAGLRDGAAVRVNGMEAGEVTDILIPASPAGRFRVRMRLREELRPLVRVDSIASIRTDGIVGGRYVQIEAGTEQSPAVDNGGAIKGREPFDFADLLDQGTKTIENVNVTINELRSHLNEVVTSINVTATNANELVTSVSDDVASIGRSGRRLSEETTRIVEGIRAGRGTIGKLVNDDELYKRIAGIAAEAEQAAKTARVAADGARAAIARLQEGGSTDGAAQSIVGELRQTLSHTRDAMSNLAENTEALKRNVLVRGYFQRSWLLRSQHHHHHRLPQGRAGRQTSRPGTSMVARRLALRIRAGPAASGRDIVGGRPRAPRSRHGRSSALSPRHPAHRRGLCGRRYARRAVSTGRRPRAAGA